MATYTYTFGGGDVLTVTASDTPTTVNGSRGYAVQTISGQFKGNSVTGLYGNGGQNQFDPSYGYQFDNTIFLSDAQGVMGSSHGIDYRGLEFTTSSGRYNVYSQSRAFYFTDPANTTSSESFVSSDAPCYCPGTAIKTAAGDVAVEDLAIGVLVVTASGAHRPIRWLGRRSYAGRFASRNPDVLPVCFKAGALAENVPARDLWVSPKHAMFLDGVLVPAECLVNGISVVRATRVDRVDYHHVELDSHDVLLAEGAPSESFVDDGSRHIFHNAREHAALYPDAARVEAVYCAPRLESGVALEAIRRRIEARAGVYAEVGPAAWAR